MVILQKKSGYITEKQLLNFEEEWLYYRKTTFKYFSYEYRKSTDFGKLYFLRKIHKRRHNVPGLCYVKLQYTHRKMLGIFRLFLETFDAERGWS